LVYLQWLEQGRQPFDLNEMAYIASGVHVGHACFYSSRSYNYLGEDFLALEELRTFFPDRYRGRMAVDVKSPKTVKAPAPAATFGQSFGQSQELCADNYA
jgi:hypothetical protein